MPQLIIGLGNPGGEYARTRHNAGWMCLEEVEARGKFAKAKKDGPAVIRVGNLDGHDAITVRPQTYMNVSGKAGTHVLSKFSADPSDVIVVHDDIDLALGRLQVRRGGGAAGQKGVQSLIDSFGTKEFIRVRIGVGRPDENDEVTDHVLGRMRPDEKDVFEKVLKKAADAVVSVVLRGLEPTMNEFNRAPTEPR